MKNMIRFFKVFKRILGARIYTLLALGVLAAFFEGLSISLFIPLLKADIHNPLKRFLDRLFSIAGMHPSFTFLLILIFVLFCLRTAVLILTAEREGKIMKGFLIAARRDILEKIFQADYGYYLSRKIGYFNNALTMEIHNISFLFKQFSTVMVSLLFLSVYLFLALLVDWKTILVLGIIALFFMGVVRKLNAKISGYSIKTTKISGEFQSFLIQALSQFKYLKATGSFRRVFNKIFEQNNLLAQLFYDNRLYSAWGEYGFFPVVMLVISAIVYIHVALMGRPIVEVLFFLFLVKQVSDKLITVQSNYRKLLNYQGSLFLFEKIEKELAEQMEISSVNKVAAIKESIVFRDVGFRHGDKLILDNVNMEFHRGLMTGILGPLGAGKSTIFNLIAGLLKPSAGGIYLDGQSYAGLDFASLREKIGYVTQEDVIFHDTLLNNITLWDREKKKELDNLLNSMKERCGLDIWGEFMK